MPKHEHVHFGEELPHNHTIQIILLIFYVVVWGLDSFIFCFTTFLRAIIPWPIHVAIGIIVFVIGGILMQLAHKALFEQEQSGLVTTGVLARVRHPMYLGTILGYLGWIIVTLSLVSFIPWLIIIYAYDKMATYEEQSLEQLLGQEYREYKKNVGKWVPH